MGCSKRVCFNVTHCLHVNRSRSVTRKLPRHFQGVRGHVASRGRLPLSCPRTVLKFARGFGSRGGGDDGASCHSHISFNSFRTVDDTISTSTCGAILNRPGPDFFRKCIRRKGRCSCRPGRPGSTFRLGNFGRC